MKKWFYEYWISLLAIGGFICTSYCYYQQWGDWWFLLCLICTTQFYRADGNWREHLRLTKIFKLMQRQIDELRELLKK